MACETNGCAITRAVKESREPKGEHSGARQAQRDGQRASRDEFGVPPVQ